MSSKIKCKCGKEISKYHLTKHQENNCIAFNPIKFKDIVSNYYDINDILMAQDILSERLKQLGHEETKKDKLDEVVKIIQEKLSDYTFEKDQHVTNIIITNVDCNNTNINSNNQNSNNQTIYNKNSYGNENIEYMINENKINEEILYILTQIDNNNKIDWQNKKFKEDFKNVMLKLYEDIHLNKHHSENHNIFVSNKKRYKSFHIFVENSWKEITGLSMLKNSIFKVYETLIRLSELQSQISEETSEQIKFDQVANMIRYDLRMLKEYNAMNKEMKEIQKSMYDKTYEKRSLIKDKPVSL